MQHSSSQKTSVAITAIVVALVIVVGSTAVNVFLMATTPAYAAPAKEKVIERNQGIGGVAEWTDISIEVPGVGTVVFAGLRVFETAEGTDIFVELITEEGNFADGFTTIDQNVFDANKKLTSATLSPVTIEVVVFDEDFNVIGTAEITIQATWEGIGDVSTTKINIHSEFDGFSEKFKGSFQVREATAEGSINNENLGTADFAELRAFKQVVMTVSESIIT
jgi:hypothetical protein